MEKGDKIIIKNIFGRKNSKFDGKTGIITKIIPLSRKTAYSVTTVENNKLTLFDGEFSLIENLFDGEFSLIENLFDGEFSLIENQEKTNGNTTNST